MYYKLFTDGQSIVGSLCLTIPLLIFTPLLVIIYARFMGADIRTSSETHNSSSFFGRIMLHSTITLFLTIAYIGIVGKFAVTRSSGADLDGFFELIVGTPPRAINQPRILMAALGHWILIFFANMVTFQNLVPGGWLRQKLDAMKNPPVRRGNLGSAHFCTPREYKRYRVEDEEGITFYGAFWGENKLRLDSGYGTFCLNGEDAARGILALGGPGSGKTQGVILPAIADSMKLGHSVILADPQGEIKHHVTEYAKVTGHLVVIHDPTSTDGPRFNLAEGINSVSDARAIADVLVPAAQGDNKFWTDSAAQLLAACLIRYNNLGEIYEALKDLKAMSAELNSKIDDAALLANSFTASVGSDGKVASNVVATLATALTGWASTEVRENTNTSDFDADLVVRQPTVVVLTCPGRMRTVYASYLGATLRKVMLDLDTIGEANRGPLPMPVNIILDEFPTLGKLDSLVADVNLVRKRRISILIAAQTKGQFHLIYGENGTQALFTGMATQIVYGGCDAETAEFYSKAAGYSTQEDKDGERPNYRQRPLLTLDEVITPQAGNATILARYVDPGYATQIVLTTRLTRFYERKDWRTALEKAKKAGKEAMLLERGIKIDLKKEKANQTLVKAAASAPTATKAPAAAIQPPPAADQPVSKPKTAMPLTQQWQSILSKQRAAQQVESAPKSVPVQEDVMKAVAPNFQGMSSMVSVTDMKERRRKMIASKQTVAST